MRSARFLRAVKPALLQPVFAAFCVCIIFMAEAIRAETSVMLLGTISVVVGVGRDLAVGVDRAFSATLSCTACSPPGWRMAAATTLDGAGGGFGHGGDGGGLALGVVDGGLLFALGARDEGLAFAGGDVDLLLAAAFGGGDQRALFALGGDLRLHGVQDFLRRRQVLDFVAQHLHAPVQRGFVDGGHHLGVDDVALLEGLVEFELADHASAARSAPAA